MELVVERKNEDVTESLFEVMVELPAERVVFVRVDEIGTEEGVSDSPDDALLEETVSERVAESLSEDLSTRDVGMIELEDRDEETVDSALVDVDRFTRLLGVSETVTLELRVAVALTKGPSGAEILKLPPNCAAVDEFEIVLDVVVEFLRLVVDTLLLSTDVDTWDRLSARRAIPAEVNDVRNKKLAVKQFKTRILKTR